MTIAPRVSLVTLGVDDVERSTAFYRSLGWPVSPASVPGEVSFFDTECAILAVWRREALAEDAGVELSPAPAYRGVALAINLSGVDEVDAAFDTVRAAGGNVTKPPVATEWGGYSGCFADPDGHLWEIAHNPGWPLTESGRPDLPT